MTTPPTAVLGMRWTNPTVNTTRRVAAVPLTAAHDLTTLATTGTTAVSGPGATASSTTPALPLGVPQPYVPAPAAPAPAAPSNGGDAASAFGHGVALFALLAAGMAALILSSRLVRRVLTDGSSAFVVSIVEWPG